MKQKTEVAIKKNITNFFGAFGYLFCLFQWFWVIMLYFSVIQSVTLLISPDTGKQIDQPPVFTFTLPDSLQWTILAVVTTIMVILAIYAFVKMPMIATKTSNKIVHKTAETIVPIIIKTRHKKDTKTLRLKLAPRLVLVIKLLLIAIPVALTLASGLLEKQPIDYLIALIIGCGLALLSMGSFTIQYLLSGLFRIKPQNLF